MRCGDGVDLRGAGEDCGDLEVKMLCAFWVGLGWVICLKCLVYLGISGYARYALWVCAHSGPEGSEGGILNDLG